MANDGDFATATEVCMISCMTAVEFTAWSLLWRLNHWRSIVLDL